VKKVNPKAYRSPLWPHVEQIRSWRRARATWDEIRQKLLDEFKIEISIQGVEAFFKRSSKVENPKGFEIERPQPEKPQPVETPPAVRTSDEQARKETKTEAYQRALKESQQKPTTLFNEEQLN
jgi:hypothetical protein